MDFQSFELTQTQIRMLEAADQVGNLCAVYRLRAEPGGGLDEARLARAIQGVIGRCLPFSYRYVKLNGSLRILLSHDPLDGLRVMDMGVGDGASVFALIRSFCGRGFRLDGGAPYHFTLLRGRDVSHLVFACHPALLDRFSLKPLFAAISAAYAELPEGEAPPLGLAQEELLRAEKGILADPKRHESVRFWLQLVRDTSFEYHPPRLEGDPSENYFSMSLSEARSKTLIRLARARDLETGDFLLFCFHIFMSRITQNDTVLTSFHHRIRAGTRTGIGFNENRLAMKSVLEPEMPVHQFLKRAGRLLAQAKFHADLPAREVGRELSRLEPEFKRTTNVLFSADPLPYEELALVGTESTLLAYFSHRRELEDVVIHHDIRDRITFHLLTRSAHESIGLKMVFGHYLALLGRIEDELEKPVGKAGLFADDKNDPLRERALELSCGSPLRRQEKGPGDDVWARFEGSVRSNPGNPAVRFGERKLTYADLHRDALAIGAGLRGKLGEGDAPLVGLCLPRSEGMIQAIFGVFSVGMGYVPLDPTMPAERLGFIASDAKLGAMIVDSKTRPILQGLVSCPVYVLEDLLKTRATGEGQIPLPETAAYVIYTSGTTGKPKGVVVERGNLAHLLSALEGIWERGPGTRWLQFASFTFDASVLDIFNPLSHGGELVIVPSEKRADPEAVFRILRENRVTHADIPPALLPLLPRSPLPDLQVIYCGGEAIDEETARFWSKAVELYNCYGPTEATVLATLNRLGGAKSTAHLGHPLPGYDTYLLEGSGELAALGGIGEICIGGKAVARGYLGRPELTAQRFIQNPYGPGRLYRTGDLARFLPNGEMEFLGRSDFQVKIRGFRIELGEIEAAIAEQPDVMGAHVGVIEHGGDKTLVGWYLAKGLSGNGLRERLAGRLPHYMIPSFLIRVENFPVTSSGKIDRARLPQPSDREVIPREEALDELQTRVREVWAQVLKVTPRAVPLQGHFFHLGGHSLLAAMLCNRLGKVLSVEVRPKALFEFPVLADFCDQVRSLPRSQPVFLPLLATRARAAPVNNRLIGLLYSRAISVPDDNMYNIVSRIEFSKEVDPGRLRDAFEGLLRENPIFHAAFKERKGQLWIEEVPIDPPCVPLLTRTDSETLSRAEELRAAPLGISQAPLWRAEIHHAPEGGVTLLFCVHHALFDGWSLNLFMEELAARYEAVGSWTPERVTWFDYCVWARDLPESRLFADCLQYWRKKLAGAAARIELPMGAGQKRPNSNEATHVRFEPETVQALKRFADGKSITLPPLLFSLYLIWIWRLSGQRELVCGYPYAGRDVPGTEEIYGTFVTMGFLRQSICPEQSFSDLALAVHRQMIEDRQYLVAAPYDAEISAMDSLNVIFSLQSGISLEGALAGASFKAHELPSLTSKGDLSGIFYQGADGSIEGRIEFDSSIFSTQAMEGFVRAFSTLVRAAAGNPGLRVGELPYQTREEAARFREFSSGPALLAPERSISGRFSGIARTYPETTALICEEIGGRRRTSYLELARWSDRISESLAGTLAPGLRVGLCMQKSDAAIAAILGILKAGCAYVPFDPGYPPERLKFFAENCGIRFVVADEESRASLISAGLGNLAFLEVVSKPGEAREREQVPPSPSEGRAVAPDSLAYVIHTSGSTGQPKGVMIEHRTVTRMIEASRVALDFDSSSRSSLVGSFSFDTSVLEIFLPLLNGGTLVIVPEHARKDPAKLHGYLRQSSLTHALLSPAMLRNMPKEPLPGLRLLAFGGDTIDEATAAWWASQTRLFTLYGPTEITVQASVGEIAPGANSRIIGKPLPGYRLYLLNQERQPVLHGTVGEICIGGDQVARGYLNRDDLTLERFVIDPFGGSPYALMYLSGDLGRFLPDGTIEFIGRNDAQIKMRGYRIELGEIENRLSTFPGIESVVCAAKGEGDGRYVAAYYVARAELADQALREHLAGFLPDYMVPSFFVRLPALPVSPNGKWDRKALPVITAKASANPPREGLERQIAEIWEEVLCLKGVGRDENFFHLGGNSLLAMRLQAGLRKRLGLQLPIGEFYGSPTIEALAAGRHAKQIDSAWSDARKPIEIASPAGPETGDQGAPRDILLTGARGFLGIFLLHELAQKVDKVYCLVRGDDGKAAILKQAEAAGLTISPERFEALAADLSCAGLGLAPGVREMLAERIDRIVHCGAFVHHIQSYATMKASNVDGTLELLRLALDQKVKPFCFVSTLTVGFALEGVTGAGETVLPNRPAVENGYILTKWVGEQVVAQAASRFGLPAVIARPGNITGSTASGFTNFSNNHFWLFTKGCLQLGAYPDIEAPIEMMPVDKLAQAIAALALSNAGGLRVANLGNPQTLTQGEFFSAAAKSGFPAKPIPAEEWQRLLESIDEANGLSTIKGFYSGDLRGGSFEVEQKATLAELATLGMALAADYDAILPLYFKYLRDACFLV